MTRNVIYVGATPGATSLSCARAIGELEQVRLLGLFEPAAADQARQTFEDFEEVDDVHDADGLLAGAEKLIVRHGPASRMLALRETLQEPLALVREQLGVAGIPVLTVRRFQDKSLTRKALEAAGLPSPRHRRVTSDEEARHFAGEVGFPLILKPLTAGGAVATLRFNQESDFENALQRARLAARRPALLEEFVLGEEMSFETLTLGGRARFESLTLYQPTILEATRDDSIQWICLLPRQLDPEIYQPVRELGIAVNQALGLDTAVTHMELFRRADGSLVVGEITLRPPGARITPMMGYCHDMNIYRAWARAHVDDAFDGPWERRYAVGTVFLRRPGAGRITAVRGVEEIRRDLGHLVIDAALPRPGAPRSSSYTGDGFITLRHDDTAVVEEGLRQVARGLDIEYSGGDEEAGLEAASLADLDRQLDPSSSRSRDLSKPAWDRPPDEDAVFSSAISQPRVGLGGAEPVD